MDISPDGMTVRFKTESEKLFEAEMSGAKPNTVCILDKYELATLQKCNPKKIIIQYEQKILLRTITNVYVTESIFGRAFVVISFINEKHHHTKPNETERDPYAHTMSLGEQEPPLAFQAINVSLELCKRLDTRCGEETYDKLISKLLDDYKSPPHVHTMSENRNSKEPFATERASTTEEEENKKLSLIGISKEMSNILVRLAHDRSMDAVIRELYEAYLFKFAEERGQVHD